MRLGFALPFADLAGGPLGPTSWADAARTAEALGYSSVWTFDAVGRGFMLPDPLMALAAAGAATERIELGTGIMQLPIRNVVEVAHRLFTLEVLTPGRVLFGVGPGSTEADFTVYGGDYGRRFDTFEEQWAQLRELVAAGRIAARDLNAWPHTLGGPALMLAGWRGGWVERAATESAGWIASGMYADDAQLAEGLARYRDAGGGRAVVTNVQAGEDLGPVIDRINHLGDVGFDDVVAIDFTVSAERMDAIAGGTVGRAGGQES
ncbi:MAG: LLM class flavin-dependent oxidoreductase [Actinomycetota bacterium]